MSRPDGGPAFARPYSEYRDGNAGDHYDDQRGMSVRDYFAAKALQGILAADRTAGYPTACENAYAFADAMLAERSKP